MRILVFNQKGGVGKTTTSLNLGAAIAGVLKREVVLIDLDPQMHLTAALGVRDEDCVWHVGHWLSGQGGQLRELRPGLSLLPGYAGLRPENDGLTDIVWPSGICIIDAPPVWNGTVASLMRAADCVLTPIEAEYLSLQGTSRLLQQMSGCGVSWDKLKLLCSRYDQRLKLHQENLERLQSRFPEQLLPQVIHRSVQLAEAMGYAQSIFEYAPRNRACQEFVALARAMIRT
ncbi:MAG: hypothetical protein RIQ52_375 [Pseudomonadota bacterium]|jgi:chromosome partitioning protein